MSSSLSKNQRGVLAICACMASYTVNDALVKKYYLAYMHGVRDYCQAYHGGPNRAEVIDIVQRTGVERNRELIDKYPWTARSPLGHINTDSMLDIQAFFVKEGLSLKSFPAERLVTSKYPAANHTPLAFLGDDVVVPEYDKDTVRVFAQPLAGGPDRLIGYAPGARDMDA